jgi:Helicase conserved C-terminal domain
MDIIYKLKQKPEPVQQKEVKITYNIVDETSSGFDRNQFIKSLQENKSKPLPSDTDDIDYVKESEYKIDNRLEIIKQFLQSKSLSYFKQLEKVSKAEMLLQIQKDTRQTTTNIKEQIYDVFNEIKSIKESDQKIEPLNNVWDEMSDSSEESEEESDEEKKEKKVTKKTLDEMSSDEDESSSDEDTPKKKRTKKNKAIVQGKYVKHSKILRYIKQYLYFIGTDIMNMEIDDILNHIEKELNMEMDDSIRKKIIELITEHNESQYYELFKPSIDPPSYYLNNRGQFIDFINKTFDHYKEKILEDEHKQSCSSLNVSDFSLLSHQQIVKDYLNIYSPYRGLLLYHGLGSGKTCASIGIAEGLKSDKQVIIMTPAALEVNYVQELKKCGDEIYKYNKHWELVPYSDGLAKLNSIPKSYTKAQTLGIWMENPDLPPNYNDLRAEQQKQINDQIEIIIKQKYIFIHYDGLRNLPANVFNNKVVIIDEAHNVSSKIANKLRNKNRKDTISMQIYDQLLNAQNCRVILLSGTPVINYPNEVAVLYNMIRGYMKTWYFNLNVESSDKIDRKTLLEMLLNDEHIGATLDYMDYSPSSKILSFTRIPHGFTNLRTNAVKYTGEYMEEDQYIKHMREILQSNQIKVVKVDTKNHKALPDGFDEFMDKFYKYDKISESLLLKRRIAGLTSYFPDIDRLLPNYSGKMNMIYCNMSDYQFSIYQELRSIEIKKDKNIKKRKKLGIKSIYDVSSTYRTFTRAACNFVFPKEVPRPIKDNEVSEEDEDDDDDDVKEVNIDVETLKKLNNPTFLHRDHLGEYSPKYLEILKHIEKYDSLHLFYSNFKKYEGVGVFRLVLLNNGYTEFKLKKVNKEWAVDVDPNDTNPKFVLHTGSVTEEEKRIIRDVFNGKWESLPDAVKKYVSKYKNNFYGDVIKILMITKSGAEGISLSNVQNVHICEPHWHPVRIEQVIGRARRICSHTALPKEDQQVRVNMYISKFSEETMEIMNTTIKLNDTDEKGKIISTDEYMYGVMSRKERVNKQMLETIKSSAIDCEIHNKQSQCMSLINPNKYTYTPSIMEDELEKESELNIKQVESKYRPVKLNGVSYVINTEYKHNEEKDYMYKEIYELDDYEKNKKTPEKLKVVGEIIKVDDKEKVKMYKK